MRQIAFTLLLLASVAQAKTPLTTEGLIPQSSPAAISFAGGALFTWSDGIVTRAGIYRSGHPIAAPLTVDNRFYSMAAADDFALVLSGGTYAATSAMRIDAQGHEILPRRFLDIQPGPVTVAWNGSKFLLVFVDEAARIWIQTLDRDLNVLTSPRGIPRQQFTVNSVAVASNSDGFVIAYSQSEYDGCVALSFCPQVPYNQVLTYATDGDGNPLQREPALIASSRGVAPVLASDGRGYALAWQLDDASGIRVAHLGSDGSLSGPLLALGSGTVSAPQIAWDGSAYAVSFGRPLLVDLVRVDRSNRVVSSSEVADWPAPSAIAVAGDRLVRAYEVPQAPIVVDELPLSKHGRVAPH